MIEFEFVLPILVILFGALATYVMQKLMDRNEVFRHSVEAFLLDELGLDPAEQPLEAQTDKMSANDFYQLQQHNNLVVGADALLGKGKLREIRYLLRQFTQSPAIIPPELKVQCKKFAEHYEQYASLLQKLHGVQRALKSGKTELIDDQLITMVPVENPILVVKQYQQSGHWHAIPCSSHITDKNSLLSWLLLRPVHPLQKDQFLNPKTYNNLPTRYVWHELTPDYCVAQELVEKAALLRVQAQELQGAWQEIANNQCTPRQLPQSFFAVTEHESSYKNDTLRRARCSVAFSS